MYENTNFTHFLLNKTENLFGQQFHSSREGMPRMLEVMTIYMHNYFEYMVLQPWIYDFWDNKIVILLAGIVSVSCESAKNLTRIGIVAHGLVELLWQLITGRRKRVQEAIASGKGDRDSKPAMLLDAFYTSTPSDTSWITSLSHLPIILNNFSTFIMAGM